MIGSFVPVSPSALVFNSYMGSKMALSIALNDPSYNFWKMFGVLIGLHTLHAWGTIVSVFRFLTEAPFGFISLVAIIARFGAPIPIFIVADKYVHSTSHSGSRTHYAALRAWPLLKRVDTDIWWFALFRYLLYWLGSFHITSRVYPTNPPYRAMKELREKENSMPSLTGSASAQYGTTQA